MSYHTPSKLDVRPTDRIEVIINYNPKRGTLNTRYFEAVNAAITAGHSTVDGIIRYGKENFPGFPIAAEIRHNLGRGYYRLIRNGEAVTSRVVPSKGTAPLARAAATARADSANAAILAGLSPESRAAVLAALEAARAADRKAAQAERDAAAAAEREVRAALG